MAKKENKMNAKEFAHELEKAASFIRQQQAEIEALKQTIDANNLNQNIGQFVKPTNEPVAWMNAHGQFNKKETWLFPIPLYTHPVKEHFEDEPQAEELHEIMQSNAELTDEEIDELANKYLYVLNDVPYANDIKDFARAILRKAQEK